MIKLIKGLILIVVGWGACHYAEPYKKTIKRYVKQSFRTVEKLKKAKFACPVASTKPFVVVIPSYNNSLWVERNLRSVFEQNYDNFRIIYIDDASTDDTYVKVQSLTEQYGQQKRVAIIHNEKNLKAVENLYRAIHTCADNEIVIFLDGDDWLPHENVLDTLNHYYADSKVWLTYGNYVDYPSYDRGLTKEKVPRRVFTTNGFRDYVKLGWPFSHLKSCYAGLFKQIKLEHVLHEGNFFASTYDQVFMLPLMEMAGKHSKRIKDVLYVYNRATALNDDKVNLAKQQECKNIVQNMPAYSPLESFPGCSETDRTVPSETADLVIFSYDRPLQLYACLESIFHHTTHTDQISVIYRCSNNDFQKAYEKLQQTFPSVRWFPESNRPEGAFKTLVLSATFNSPARYVAFVVDDIVVKDTINFADCTAAMDKTGAYGFYLKLGDHVDYCYTLNCHQGIPFHISLSNTIRAWQFNVGQADWRYPNTLDMTLYKKKDIENELRTLKFDNPSTLESEWAKRPDLDRIGLFYTSSKSVNIPLNIVGPFVQNRHMDGFSKIDLLKKFDAGLKLNITPFFQVKNHAAHMECEPKFVHRDDHDI